MCGICGLYNFETGAPADRGTVERMTRTIVHRGPDDEGIHVDGSLALGFRRLAIIDLSPAGHQPMSDPHGTVWVTFNGEIYNFMDVRRELEAHGHVFRSQCDTEVIVHGYKQWGDAVLDRLNGMFGLAIWDTKTRRLMLARDPMGIKPLYYSIHDGTVYWGSEIRAVRAAVPVQPSPDVEAMALFLRYRYTPAPRTMFAGIRKLAAGEKLVVRDSRAEVLRYYQYEPVPFAPQPRVDEAAEQLLDLYKDAVRRQLMSDVPLGLLLSGGMDSGLLLGLMNLHGKAWPTFTVGYGASFRDDELSDAAETARLLGAEHHVVRISQDSFEEALPRIVGALEEPVASSSIVPMYFVCQRAREVVKVALIGQGPDELFGGYTRHLGVHYGAAWRSLPRWMQAGSAALAGALLPRNDTVKRGLYSLNESDQLRRFQRVFSLTADAEMESLFLGGAGVEGSHSEAYRSWASCVPAMRNLDELNAFQLLELRSSLPDELLMYGDKLSMAHALEARVPYLDRPVVEHVQRLGASFKVRNGVRKWLHRRVARKFLPREIVGRKKRGFAVNVVDDWFRKSLHGRFNDYLADGQSLIYRHVRHATVTQWMKEHAAGQKDHHKILFSLVVLEQWLRNQTDAA
ncbi:asparagine synthase (glutamine-hydrolyzing) [Luteitalea sp.]|jgi:asparagine synthase (glutamine-hydrolysing)|uniref:asparagine synthase (glutamine-hydrolyzing) n=1 Tax=Luteitalea sp. TaxID=2004800 RepID=UPI0037C5482B